MARALFFALWLANSVVAQQAPVGEELTGPVEEQPEELSESEAANLEFPVAPKPWGLAAVMRTAEIPYETMDKTVSSFVPLMFYEGEYGFMRGLGGGFHAWKSDVGDELNVLARMRFMDIPAELQNEVQGDTVDFGLQYRGMFDDAWWETEAMSDPDGKWYLALRFGASPVLGRWRIRPSVELRYLSSTFTSRYFALTPETGNTAQGAFQFSPGVDWRYQVFSDLHLLGSLRYTWFSSGLLEDTTLNTEGTLEFTLGFGLFQDPGSAPLFGWSPSTNSEESSTLARPYIRLAHGWGTPSDLGDILGGSIENDEFDNSMNSVFYGLPLTDSLFGVPVEVYLSPGFALHDSSAVQNTAYELVLSMKAYYTIHWPIRWRLGLAEGLSWINRETYLEGEDLAESGQHSSQLMNYMGFSVDLNVGDLFGAESLEGLWAGVAIHHRSSIFESASQFGRITGGSNYPSVYLQVDLF